MAALTAALGQLNMQLNEMADSGGQLKKFEKRKTRLATPSWSPTELGEKILGFYAEAGAEDSRGRAD